MIDTGFTVASRATVRILSRRTALRHKLRIRKRCARVTVINAFTQHKKIYRYVTVTGFEWSR